jgi:hypothetical protein
MHRGVNKIIDTIISDTNIDIRANGKRPNELTKYLRAIAVVVSYDTTTATLDVVGRCLGVSHAQVIYYQKNVYPVIKFYQPELLDYENMLRQGHNALFFYCNKSYRLEEENKKLKNGIASVLELRNKQFVTLNDLKDILDKHFKEIIDNYGIHNDSDVACINSSSDELVHSVPKKQRG